MLKKKKKKECVPTHTFCTALIQLPCDRWHRQPKAQILALESPGKPETTENTETKTSQDQSLWHPQRQEATNTT